MGPQTRDGLSEILVQCHTTNMQAASCQHKLYFTLLSPVAALIVLTSSQNEKCSRPVTLWSAPPLLLGSGSFVNFLQAIAVSSSNSQYWSISVDRMASGTSDKTQNML